MWKTCHFLEVLLHGRRGHQAETYYRAMCLRTTMRPVCTGADGSVKFIKRKWQFS